MKKSFLSKSISLALISMLLGCGSGGGEDSSQQAQNQQNPPTPNISQLSYFPYYAESPAILPLFQLNEEISNVGKDFSIVSRVVEVVRGLDFHDYINRKTPHISSRYENLTATSKRKSFVSQYERIKRNANGIIRTQSAEMNQLVFNSGYADTSYINNKTLLSQLFDYDRLERDKNINSVVDRTRNIKDNSELSKLMNQNARIMVLDTGFGNVLGLDESRIIERWIDDNKGERVIPDNPYHGDKVLTQLFVDQNYTGLMRDKGEIYFIGVYSNTPNIYEAYRSPYIEEGLKLGYNIFNASWLYYLDENKGKLPNESWVNWFKRGKFSESPHYLSARKIVDGLNEYAKQDLLFVNALGNEREEGNVSYIGYYLLDNKDRLKPLLNSTIFVGGYRLDKQALPNYANRCDDLKYYCLVANDEVVAYYRDDEGALWAYKEYGSSFSTPLVSATAGLLKSVYPFMTNENLQTTILTTAEDLGIKGVDKDYGWGLLRTDRAVNGPMQFWDKDFIVNLSHNQSQQNNKAIYNFSNDISGQYGLTVTGDQNKKNALSLSGFNTYQGDTTVKAGGILNIDGVLTNSHTRISNGSVYGSGLLSDVTNAGNLYAYSLYRYTDPTSTRSQFGMIIDGNYTQDIKGNLFVLLGQPLAVTGNVSLDGRLVVNGVKRGYVSNFGKVFGDVIVAKGNITGSFKDVKVLSKFLNYDDISYNTLNVGDEVISTVSVYATYKGLAENLDLFTSIYDPFYDIAKSTANTLDNLNQKINEQVAKNEVFESPALDLMADIQSADVAEVKQAVKALSGNEYAEITDWHDYYADKKAFLNRIKNLSIRQGVSYDYQQGHGLTVQYGENDLQYGVGVFESSYDDTRHSGVNLNLNKDLNGFNLISHFNYEQLKTDLSRHTELFSQSYANVLKLKQRHYGVGLTLNKMFEWDNHQFNLFTGYDFRRQQLKGIEENIGVKLGYPTQYHNDHNLTFGVGYNWSWSNFNLGLNYAHLVHLNHNNIQGYLKDDMVYSDHTILKHKDKHTDFWQAALSYQWDKVNLGLNYTHSTKDKNVGAKIELTF